MRGFVSMSMGARGNQSGRWLVGPWLPVVRQLAAVAVASVVLGFAYNAASPIGIRWSEAPAVTAANPLLQVVSAPAGQLDSPTQPSPPSVAQASSAPVSAHEPALVFEPEPLVHVPPSATTWAEVKPLLARGEVVLVDSRSRAAFEAVHIPGAVWLPEPPGEKEWTEFTTRHSRDQHLVVYCSSSSCSVSYRLAHRLAREGGYTFAQYMTGGLHEWQREETLARAASAQRESPVAASAERGEAGADRIVTRTFPRPAPELVAPAVGGEAAPGGLENALPISWAQAQPMLGTGQILLLDARSRDEYEAGHIPGALSLPVSAQPAYVRRQLAGHPASTRLVAYCGAMGCPEAFQLATRLLREFGFANAQFLFEGYAEWQHRNRVADESSP
jgi:rhodanese-related sulfurtransferase